MDALLILPFLGMLGVGMAVAAVTGRALSLTLLPAASCMVFLAMLGALAGPLTLVQTALVATGVAALGLMSLFRFRRGLALPEPALVLWGAALVCAWWVTKDLPLIFWDEFSHWGTLPKFMLLSGRLPERLGEIIFIEYPIGWPVWAYLILHGPGFSEGGLLFSAAALQVTAFLPILAGVRWRDAPVFLPVVCALLVVGSIFGLMWFNWTAVSIDNTFPLTAAAALIIYMKAGRDTVACLLAAPVLAMACMLKGAGMPAAGTIAAAILADQIWNLRGRGMRAGGGMLLKRAAVLAAPPLLAMLFWSAHVGALAQPSIFDTSWPTLRTRIADPEFAGYASSIAEAFRANLMGLTRFSRLDLTLGTWLLVFLGLAMAAILPRRREALPILAIHAVLMAGFAAYAALLLFYFMFAFVPYEAVRLAGMERYLSSFLLMWLACGFGLVVSQWRAAVSSKGAWLGGGLTVACSLALLLAMGESGMATALAPARNDPFSAEVLRERAQVRDALDTIQERLPPDASVYVLWNRTTGLPYYVSHYELKPHRTSTPQYIRLGADRFQSKELWCHSLGTPRFPNDVWSCPWSMEKFYQEIEGFDYVFIGFMDKEFLDLYGDAFENPEEAPRSHFFRVHRDGGRVRLSGIDAASFGE